MIDQWRNATIYFQSLGSDLSTLLFDLFKKQADPVCKEVKAILSRNIQIKLLERYGSNWSEQQYNQVTDLLIEQSPLVLCGFSQGGNIVVEIANNRHHYGLNIIGGILMLTDLSGVIPFQKGMEDLNAFKQPDIRAGFEIVLGKPVDANYDKMWWAKVGVSTVSPALNFFGYETAIESMRPNSASNLYHRRFVREGKDITGAQHNIPILIVAGHIGNTNDYYEYDTSDKDKVEKVKAFDRGLNKFMSGSENVCHDGAVIFPSNLCRGESLEDISEFSRNSCNLNIERGNINYVMPNKPDNVDIYIVDKDVFHGKAKFKVCFAEFDNPKMQQSQQLYDIEAVRSKIIEWLNTIIPKENNAEQ